MNFLTPLIAFSVACISATAQGARVVTQKELTGLWQAKSAEVGSGFLQVYRFFPDGTFTFGFSQYAEPKRFLKLHGRYSISGGLITFRITHRTDLTGGEIVRGGPAADGEWVLEGGKQTTVKQSGKSQEPVEIKFITNSGISQVGISIEGNEYFKVSSDPHNQE